MQPFDQQLMWLVSPGKQPDPSVAECWLASLYLESGIAYVKDPFNTQHQQLGESFHSHCHKVDQHPDNVVLKNNNSANDQWILTQIYTIFSDNNKSSVIDPLMLMVNIW
ncbi:MAG TPA: hypothetical protein ACHBX0_06735 [Arsenophonus sp.]